MFFNLHFPFCRTEWSSCITGQYPDQAQSVMFLLMATGLRQTAYWMIYPVHSRSLHRDWYGFMVTFVPMSRIPITGRTTINHMQCVDPSTCVYIYIYIHTYMHIYRHTYMHACMHACIPTYLPTYSYVRTFVRTYERFEERFGMRTAAIFVLAEILCGIRKVEEGSLSLSPALFRWFTFLTVVIPIVPIFCG